MACDRFLLRNEQELRTYSAYCFINVDKPHGIEIVLDSCSQDLVLVKFCVCLGQLFENFKCSILKHDFYTIKNLLNL